MPRKTLAHKYKERNSQRSGKTLRKCCSRKEDADEHCAGTCSCSKSSGEPPGHLLWGDRVYLESVCVPNRLSGTGTGVSGRATRRPCRGAHAQLPPLLRTLLCLCPHGGRDCALEYPPRPTRN